jgi:serine/threonine protein kinase
MGASPSVTTCTSLDVVAEDAPLSVEPFHSRYVLGRKLGQGAFSTVYVATSIACGGDVAVKVTDLRATCQGNVAGATNDPKTEEVVQTEVEVLKQVRDKDCCIQLYEACKEGVLSYIIMELCEFSLCQAFESLPELNERTIVRCVKGMLQALEVLHDAKIVHRDIKPDNFLCSGEDMQVKLCDFGLAKVMTSEACSLLSGVVGTPPFMSPEMIGNTGYGTATDVWSLGVTVYVMLFGCFPYEPEGRNKSAMKEAILLDSPAPSYKLSKAVKEETTQKPDISKDAIAFMRELLDRSPICRPSAKEAQHMLWISLPETAETRSARCLQPTFQAAKEIGAFHPWARAQKEDQPDGFDAKLSPLQAKHASRQSSKGTVSTTASMQ